MVTRLGVWSIWWYGMVWYGMVGVWSIWYVRGEYLYRAFAISDTSTVDSFTEQSDAVINMEGEN